MGAGVAANPHCVDPERLRSWERGCRLGEFEQGPAGANRHFHTPEVDGPARRLNSSASAGSTAVGPEGSMRRCRRWIAPTQSKPRSGVTVAFRRTGRNRCLGSPWLAEVRSSRFVFGPPFASPFGTGPSGSAGLLALPGRVMPSHDGQSPLASASRRLRQPPCLRTARLGPETASPPPSGCGRDLLPVGSFLPWGHSTRPPLQAVMTS